MLANTRERRLLLAAVCTAGLVGCGTPAGSTHFAPRGKRAASIKVPQYTVVDLRVLAGYGPFYPHRINNRGEIIGWAMTKSKIPHAMMWRKGRLLPLGGLGRGRSFGLGINDAGLVLGQSETSDKFASVFLWSKGKVTRLGPKGTVTMTNGGMNVKGWCVGQMKVGHDSLHACRWADGRVLDIGTLGGKFSVATAINSRGDIVGLSNITDRRWHATLWRDGKPRDLGAQGPDSRAERINDAGTIIGRSDLTATRSVAFEWADGRMRTLPTLKGFNGNMASGINKAGVIVGVADGRWPHHAIMWRQGKIYDLNACIPSTPAWRLETAWDINDKGQIIGQGVRVGDSQPVRAFLLTPR